MRRPSRPVLAAATVAALSAGLVGTVPTGADAADRLTQGRPTAIGRGGAVSTVDAEATRAGLRVLRRGGNAVDAAVATAAALGVTEPFSAGAGGGGFFVYFDAAKKKVFTLDGRETAPRAMTSTSFQEGGEPIDFNEAVTSGLSVGVPGTPGTAGARSRSARPSGRRRGSPGAASSSTAPSASRSSTTRRGSPTSRRPAGCSSRAASRRPSARCSATGISPGRTTSSAPRASAGSIAVPSASGWSARSASRR
jgi:hypothetical protein